MKSTKISQGIYQVVKENKTYYVEKLQEGTYKGFWDIANAAHLDPFATKQDCLKWIAERG